MAPLLDALNGLFERIAALMDSERRFTADAAHELRTPIAAIRAQAQVALARPTTNAARTRCAPRWRLRPRHALVEQLLTLSRLEAGATPCPAPVDLAAGAQRGGRAGAAALAAARRSRSTPTPCAVCAATPRCWPCWCATWSTTRCATAPTARRRVQGQV
jgi:two-component system sensor histidine kinase QseC